MKKFFACISFSLLVLSLPAFSLEVGDTAPCVVLEQISVNGQGLEQCIREPRIPRQIKYLEFFSVNCSACRTNLPLVSSLHQQYGDLVTFRLISIDRSEAAIRQYLSEFRHLINFPVAMDLNRDAKNAYQVQATPTTYLLDANDVVIYKHVGVLSAADLAQLGSIFTQE